MTTVRVTQIGVDNGLMQRDGHGGWITPRVGDHIEVSDLALPGLLARGYAERVDGDSVGHGKRRRDGLGG